MTINNPFYRGHQRSSIGLSLVSISILAPGGAMSAPQCVLSDMPPGVHIPLAGRSWSYPAPFRAPSALGCKGIPRHRLPSWKAIRCYDIHDRCRSPGRDLLTSVSSLSLPIMKLLTRGLSMGVFPKVQAELLQSNGLQLTPQTFVFSHHYK
jgi:hypothetical protein